MLLRILSTLILLSSATSAAANIYDECDAAISEGNAAVIDDLANTLLNFNSFSRRSLKRAEACVSASLGVPMVYSSLGWVELSDREATAAEILATEAERLRLEAVSEAERLRLEAASKAERLELERLQSIQNMESAKIAEHHACISAKMSQVLSEIEAIDKKTNETNGSLILNDTYSACSELYRKDKSSAMLNQSCIDAFERLGHPNLVRAGDELKAAFMDHLAKLSMEQSEVQDTLSSYGVRTQQDIAMVILSAVLEEKSCAEFGYEGIYRD